MGKGHNVPSSRQTPQRADWPSCGDPRFQDRLFVPWSWVCLITGIELNVLFLRFPADTRHQLHDERPLLPPAQHPTASFSDLPLEKALVPPWKILGISGHRESEGDLWTSISSILARVLPKQGHGLQAVMTLWMGS